MIDQSKLGDGDVKPPILCTWCGGRMDATIACGCGDRDSARIKALKELIAQLPSDTQVRRDVHDRNVLHVYARPGSRVVIRSCDTGDVAGTAEVPKVPT